MRYFNAAGADPEAEIGEVHNPETQLIPLALDVVLGQREELAVFGNGYPTPDGTCIRDYIHVTRCRAHVISLKQLENKGPVGLSVNLGTEKAHRFFEIINACKEIGGRKVNYRIAPAREGDPPSADPSQALKLLTESDYADIRMVIQHAWEFQKKAESFV